MNSLERASPQSDPFIVLGNEVLTMNSQPRGLVRPPLDSFKRHAFITGTTGSGKSTTAKVMCKGLAAHHIPTTVLDRTGEYAEALVEHVENVVVLKPGDNLSIALFAYEKDKEDDLGSQIEGWLSLLRHFYFVSHGEVLSPLQGHVLRDIFSDYYHGSTKPLTVLDLVSRLDRVLRREAQNLNGWPESIEAAISRLVPLTVGEVSTTFNRSYSTFNVSQLFEPKLTIIDLSVLSDDHAKDLLSQVILKQVYDETRRRGKIGQDGAISLAFLIDEAHHICPNKRDYISIPEKCAIELRKYGFSLITAATRPCLVSPNIIANSNLLISHMLNNQEDIEAAAGFFIGGNSINESLRRLAVGEAMVQVNFPKPLNAIRCKVSQIGSVSLS